MFNMRRQKRIILAIAIAVTSIVTAGCTSGQANGGSSGAGDGPAATTVSAISAGAVSGGAAQTEGASEPAGAEDLELLKNFMVVNGQKTVAYGMTMEETTNILGQAKASPLMSYYQGGVSLLYSESGVQAIALGDIEGEFAKAGITMDTNWKTANGIGIGDTESALKEAYPNAVIVSDEEDVDSPFVIYCDYYKLDNGRWIADDDPEAAQEKLEQANSGLINDEDYLAFMYKRMSLSFYLDPATREISYISFWSGME